MGEKIGQLSFASIVHTAAKLSFRVCAHERAIIGKFLIILPAKVQHYSAR